MVVGILKVSLPALLSAALAFSGAPLAAQSGALPGPVPVALLETRREALLAQLGSGIAVLPSAPVLDEESNGDYPQGSYRQDNDFYYFTGNDDVNAALLEIVGEHGGMDADDAQAWVAELTADGRYLRDVY